jgi:hypothetical protein
VALNLALYAKAITAAITSAGSLLTAAAVDHSITSTEWVTIIAGFLVTTGSVFTIPNAKYPADEPATETPAGVFVPGRHALPEEAEAA